MRIRSWTVVACLALGLSFAACARHHTPEDGSVPGSPDQRLAAEFDDGSVALGEVDAAIGAELDQLQSRVYALRLKALKPLITEQLVNAEAKRRGMTPEQLLEVEVKQRVPEATREELEAFYRAHPKNFAKDTKTVALMKIQDAMFKAHATRRRDAFEQQLWQRARVRLLIQPPRRKVPIPPDAPTLGPDDAPVTIVEFTDYECPYCRASQKTVDEVLQRYAGKIRLVSRDLPQGDLHPEAPIAARAAHCAGEQNRFWEYHRDLLLEPDALTKELLIERAVRLGAKRAQFAACLDSDRYDAMITRSVAESKHLRVSATPTFFINGRRLVGAASLEDFAEIIDDELERAGA